MICLFSISNGQDFEAEKIRLSNKFSKILEYIDKYNKVKATKEREIAGSMQFSDFYFFRRPILAYKIICQSGFPKIETKIQIC